MSTTQMQTNHTAAGRASAEMKLEVVVLPVSDVDRAKTLMATKG